MKIYNGTGDFGETSNLSGQKISKNDVSIHFIGEADELNSHLGLVKALLSDGQARQFIEEIQKKIMKLMSHACAPADSRYFFCDDEVKVLETEIDKLTRDVQENSQFVLPGKNVTEAQIHIARAVARRTERLFFAVSERLPLCQEAGAYLNRLSDYLFALSQHSA
jgi:cob(I)alamin adenosyltransferase